MQDQLWESSIAALGRKDQADAVKEDKQAGIPTTVEEMKKEEEDKEIKKAATIQRVTILAAQTGSEDLSASLADASTEFDNGIF